MAFQFGTKKMKARQSARQEKRKMKRGRKAGEKAAKSTKGMVGFGYGEPGKEGRDRAAAVGAKAGTKVRKGAVGVKKTKGGDYVKYGKKTEAAGSFRSAFKKACAGDAKSFSWDGRSYSCKKK